MTAANVHAALLDLAELARAVYDQVDHAIASIDSRSITDQTGAECRVQCGRGPGCNACCTLLLSLTLPEALLLALHLDASPGRLDRVLRSDESARQASVLSRPKVSTRSYQAERVTCPLLCPRTGLCTAYTVRPLSCRLYLVTTPPHLCASPGAMIGAVDVRELRFAAMAAFDDASRALGIPSYMVPFPEAVRIATDLLRHGPAYVADRLDSAGIPTSGLALTFRWAGAEFEDGLAYEHRPPDPLAPSASVGGAFACRVCGTDTTNPVDVAALRCTSCGFSHHVGPRPMYPVPEEAPVAGGGAK